MSTSGQNPSLTSHPIDGSLAAQCSISQGWELALDHLGMEEGHLLNHRHHILKHLPSKSSLGPPLMNFQGLKRSRLESISLQILNFQSLVFILHFKINILLISSIFFILKFYNTFSTGKFQAGYCNSLPHRQKSSQHPYEGGVKWKRGESSASPLYKSLIPNN